MPVIAQWFAAQALLLGEVEVEQLLAAPEDIDLWLYPLAIAVATGLQDQGAAVLEPIMRALPGFAFLVIDEALGTVGFDDVAAPPWGEQMRAAMQTMADGLGGLGRLALPLDEHGVVVPLAVSTEGSRVDYAIWEGEERRDPVHAMPGTPPSSSRLATTSRASTRSAAVLAGRGAEHVSKCVTDSSSCSSTSCCLPGPTA